MIIGPSLPKTLEFVVVDGMNIALRRLGQRAGAFADLENTVEFFKSHKIHPIVVLDRRAESEAFAARIPPEKRKYVWIVDQGWADIVVLEVAHRLPAAAIVSNDDFAEYQKRYAGVIFDPTRILGFEWQGSVGSGTLAFRRIQEKAATQALTDTALLRQFPHIADILFAAQRPAEAEAFLTYIRATATSLGKEISPAEFDLACKNSPKQTGSRMNLSVELSKDCKPEDVAGKGDGELYALLPAVVAQAGNELKDYAGKIMCRKHMFILAARYQLNPDRDFQTKEALVSEANEEKKKLTAYSKLVEWLISYELLPEINGKAPMFGGQHICRKCAETFSTSELLVFEKRFVQNLHPDLTDEGVKPEGRLLGRALCRTHFDEVTEHMGSIEQEFNLNPRTVFVEGKNYLTLEKLFEFSNNSKRGRF